MLKTWAQMIHGQSEILNLKLSQWVYNWPLEHLAMFCILNVSSGIVIYESNDCHWFNTLNDNIFLSSYTLCLFALYFKDARRIYCPTKLYFPLAIDRCNISNLYSKCMHNKLKLFSILGYLGGWRWRLWETLFWI